MVMDVYNEVRSSIELSKYIDVSNKNIIKYYWELDNKLAINRNFIKCKYVSSGKNSYLDEMCDSLIFAILLNFDKLGHFQKNFSMSRCL